MVCFLSARVSNTITSRISSSRSVSVRKTLLLGASSLQTQNGYECEATGLARVVTLHTSCITNRTLSTGCCITTRRGSRRAFTRSFAHARSLSTKGSAADSAAQLLVVYHSRTGLAEQMSYAIVEGAEEVALEISKEDVVEDDKTVPSSELTSSENGMGTVSSMTLVQQQQQRTGEQQQQGTGKEVRVQNPVLPMIATVTPKLVTKLRIVLTRVEDVGSRDLLKSAGVIFVCPENLGAMSGAMKEFFDITFYEMFVDDNSSADENLVSLLADRPYGIAIAAGSDGNGAGTQLKRICTGWRMRQTTPDPGYLVCRNGLVQTKTNILSADNTKKKLTPQQTQSCKELGGIVVAQMLLNI